MIMCKKEVKSITQTLPSVTPIISLRSESHSRSLRNVLKLKCTLVLRILTSSALGKVSATTLDSPLMCWISLMKCAIYSRGTVCLGLRSVMEFNALGDGLLPMNNDDAIFKNYRDFHATVAAKVNIQIKFFLRENVGGNYNQFTIKYNLSNVVYLMEKKPLLVVYLSYSAVNSTLIIGVHNARNFQLEHDCHLTTSALWTVDFGSGLGAPRLEYLSFSTCKMGKLGLDSKFAADSRSTAVKRRYTDFRELYIKLRRDHPVLISRIDLLLEMLRFSLPKAKCNNTDTKSIKKVIPSGPVVKEDFNIFKLWRPPTYLPITTLEQLRKQYYY
uniref:PX domain-containing protein n=1 Tax=Glossina pallidipes TaxID=7398 RepID=A0A1A9ZQL2_GLOPL